MTEQIEKQAIEEMAKVIKGTEKVALESVGALPSPTMYAKELYWHGYRKRSEMLVDFLKMVENICAMEERLCYQTIEEGIKRQMAMKGGAE